MNVETVPIASLTLRPSNVRKHPTRNVEDIKRSLTRFGQRTPIVLDGAGVVHKGNGTLIAARALGWTEIKVVRYSDLTATEMAAYAIADNQTGLTSEWDDLVLAKSLDALKCSDVDLFKATGFDVMDFDKLIRSLGDVEILGIQDATEAPFKDSITWDRIHGQKGDEVLCLIGDVEFCVGKKLYESWKDRLEKGDDVKKAARAWLENALR